MWFKKFIFALVMAGFVLPAHAQIRQYDYSSGQDRSLGSLQDNAVSAGGIHRDSDTQNIGGIRQEPADQRRQQPRQTQQSGGVQAPNYSGLEQRMRSQIRGSTTASRTSEQAMSEEFPLGAVAVFLDLESRLNADVLRNIDKIRQYKDKGLMFSVFTKEEPITREQITDPSFVDKIKQFAQNLGLPTAQAYSNGARIQHAELPTFAYSKDYDNEMAGKYDVEDYPVLVHEGLDGVVSKFNIVSDVGPFTRKLDRQLSMLRQQRR